MGRISHQQLQGLKKDAIEKMDRGDAQLRQGNLGIQSTAIGGASFKRGAITKSTLGLNGAKETPM